VPTHALYDDDFRFLLDLALPVVNYDDYRPLSTLTVCHPDSSTAQISPGGRIRQHGPRHRPQHWYV
jgi:hypothetical protein